MNINEIYRDAVKVGDTETEVKINQEKAEQIKLEDNNLYAWEQWRNLDKTQEFLIILQNQWVERSKMIGTLGLTFPQSKDLMGALSAELGTLQKVLQTTMIGKYE